jgi:Dolichyl-phosphate-mannose-protein mannosyltransferase
MLAITSRSYLTWFRMLMATVLGLAFVFLLVDTYRWPLVWDAQVFHYIIFLIGKGYAPYRNITDMNMPGTYLIEGWAMHLFGGGDLAWRMYDFTLLGLLGAALIVIAKPYDWVAGLFSGVMFALVHATEGPENSAQRDEAMTMLIMVGYAFLFEALRRRKPWMMAVSGLSLGMACSVKPTALPLAVALLAMAWWTLRKRDEVSAPYLCTGITGAGVAAAIVFGFLFRYHSLGAFLEISRKITPYYAGLHHPSFGYMVRRSLPRVALLMLPFGLVAAYVDREWRSWERWALLLGVAFGAFSYAAQHKGYQYHRYTLVTFLLLWMAIELSLAMRKHGWIKVVGVAGMALGVLIMVPVYVQRVWAITPTNEYTPSLVRDLTQLGGDKLQRKVQCLDLVDGCLNALYRLKILPSTDSMGDLLFFSSEPSPVVDYYRNQFQQQLNENPPSVIVLSKEWFNHDEGSFDKVNEWPQFAAYLAENYTLAVSRDFPLEQQRAYRIYVRRGVSLPHLDQ